MSRSASTSGRSCSSSERANAMDAGASETAAAVPVLCSWMTHQQAQQGTSFLLSSHQAFAEGALPVMQQLLIEHATLRYPG